MTARSPVAIFQEQAIREAISLNLETIAVIEEAFRLVSSQGIDKSPMMQVHVRDHGGQTCIKGAWVPAFEHFAVKLSSSYPRPPGANAAEPNGLSVLIESATGRVTACLLDNGYLTELRTAAAGAV